MADGSESGGPAHSKKWVDPLTPAQRAAKSNAAWAKRSTSERELFGQTMRKKSPDILAMLALKPKSGVNAEDFEARREAAITTFIAHEWEVTMGRKPSLVAQQQPKAERTIAPKHIRPKKSISAEDIADRLDSVGRRAR